MYKAKIGDAVRYTLDNSYFGILYSLDSTEHSSAPYEVHDYTKTSTGVNVYDSKGFIDYKKWFCTDLYSLERDPNAEFYTIAVDLDEEWPEEKHIMGLSPEVIDWAAYKSFMRELQS